MSEEIEDDIVNEEEPILGEAQYREYEGELIKKFLRDEDFLKSYYRSIPVAAFTRIKAIILKIVYEELQKTNKLIKENILRAKIIEKKYKEQDELLELLDEFYDNEDLPNEDAIKICIRHITINHIRTSLTTYDEKFSAKDDVNEWKNGLDKLSTQISQMMSNTSSVSVLDFASSFEKFSEEKIKIKKEGSSKGQIVKTSIEQLDQWTPTRKGTVNSLLGRTKVGKSIIMSNLGFGAYQSGANVLIVILENSEAQVLTRLYSRAGYVKYKKIQNWDFDESQEQEIKRRLTCYSSRFNKLFVYKGEQYKTNCLDIANILRIIYDKYGIKIDLLINDYAQIMASHKMSSEKGDADWRVHEQIIWEMKSLAVNFAYDIGDSNMLAIWTALQTNRGAWSTTPGKNGEESELKDVSVFDIAGGYNVIPALDNLVFINQNRKEKEDKILRLTPSIARDDASSESNHIILETNYEHMMIDRNNLDFDWGKNCTPLLLE